MARQLSEIVDQVPGFSGQLHVEKIRFFAWYLMDVECVERFSGAQILKCYDDLGMERPTNVSKLLIDMSKKQPKEILTGPGGYRLEKRVRDTLAAKYGQRESTIVVDQLLLGLPAAIPKIDEREFLEETLRCFRAGAFRATIVMAWNLAYDHFVGWIIASHLGAFNAQARIVFSQKYSKGQLRDVVNRDDFGMYRESEVLKVAKLAGLITSDLERMLEQHLGRRNSAAHPSSIEFTRLSAEQFVDELVRNVVLKLV